MLCLTSTWPCWNSIASLGQDTLKENKRMQNNFENPEESTEYDESSVKYDP